MVALLGGTSETYRIVISVGGTLYGEYGSGRAITTNASGTLSAYIYVGSGTTVNLTYYPMLTSGNTQKPYQKYVGGQASPNPTYPQDIEVVTGTQEVIVSNSGAYNKDFKNLPNTYQAVKYIQSDGNQYFYLSSQWGNTSKIEAIIGTDNEYNNNVIFSESSSASVWIGFSNSTTMSGGGFTNLTITPQATTTSYKTLSTITFSYSLTSTGNIRWGTYATSTYNKTNRIASLKLYDTNNTLIRNMVACYRKSDNVIGMYDLANNVFYTNEGSGSFTKGDDLQSQTKTLHLGDIELGGIGTYQNRIFESSGKNKYDSNNVIENALIQPSASKIGATSECTTIWFKCTPNTTYTLSRDKGDRLVIGGSNTQPVISGEITTLYDVGVSEVKTYTFNSGNFEYIAIYISRYNTSKPTIIMINEGSTALPYEPYGSDKWYIEKNIYKDTSVKSHTWSKSSRTDVHRYYCNFTSDIRSGTDEIRILSNYFLGITATSSDSGNTGIANFNTTGYMVNLPLSSSLNTLETFTTFLNSSNVIAYYVLATPTYTEITNTTLLNELNEIEKMMSYNGQTNISVSGNLPMILDISALKGE